MRALSGPDTAPILQDDVALGALNHIRNHVLPVHPPGSPVFRHARQLIDDGLRPVASDTIQSLLQRDVPGLQPDTIFARHCRGYFTQLFGDNPLLGYSPTVSTSTPPGDCGIHSTNICLTGGEQTGRYALRLRAAINLATHADAIIERSKHHEAAATFADEMPHSIKDAFRPRAYLGKVHLAALANVLKCPIYILHPGIHGPSGSNYRIVPLGVPDTSYASKTPLLLFFTRCTNDLHAQPGHFAPNHYCPGDLQERSHYEILRQSRRMAIKDYFENPSSAAHSLPAPNPAERWQAETIARTVLELCQGRTAHAAPRPLPSAGGQKQPRTRHAGQKEPGSPASPPAPTLGKRNSPATKHTTRPSTPAARHKTGETSSTHTRQRIAQPAQRAERPTVSSGQGRAACHTAR
jgi:hypothetical protein